jgi:hypothetical protein
VKKNKLLKLIQEAEDVGLTVPADILLSMAKEDVQKAMDDLKVEVEIKPEDLPIFTLTQPGAVPAPKLPDLILSSKGWTTMPKPTNRVVYAGGAADHDQLKHLDYASAGHTGFEPTITYPITPDLGGTGVANLAASTLTLGAATSITGGGTIALGGFTGTLPATGTFAVGAGTLTSITTNDVTGATHTHAITPSPTLLGNGTSQYQTIITGANPFVPVYSGFLLDGTAGGKTSFAVTNTKTLTLTSAGDYNLTIPATGIAALLATKNVFTVQQKVDGTADEIQLIVQAHSTQITNLQEWQNSSAGVLAGINSLGFAKFGGAPAADTICYAITTVTQTAAGGFYGLRGQLTLQAAGTSAVTAVALDGLLLINSAQQYTATGNSAIQGKIWHNSTQQYDYFNIANLIYTRTSTGTVYSGVGVNITGLDTAGISHSKGIQIANVVGTSSSYAILTNAGNIVFNEGGDSATDFRVESDTEANMLFLDANADTDGALYLGGTTNGIKVNKGGTLSMIGTAGLQIPHLMQSDSTDQAIANVSNAQVITFDTDVHHFGITRTSTSRFTITRAGSYLVTFSGIASGVATKLLEVWLRINGADVANSNTIYQFKGTAQSGIVSVSFIQHFDATDYFEFWTWGDDTGCKWDATAAGSTPTRPASPSIIMTCNYVGVD